MQDITQLCLVTQGLLVLLCAMLIDVRIAVLILVVFTGYAAIGQPKQVETSHQAWMAWFHQTRLSDRSGTWLDVQHRRAGDFIERPTVSLVRGGYSYYFSDLVSAQVGYAYVHFSFAGAAPSLHEHRPWQQVQWMTRGRRLRTIQWVRAEQRFREIEDRDYQFNWRFRQNIALFFPFGHESAEWRPFLTASNELHVNAGKNVQQNYFDQNRLFVGVGCYLGGASNIQLGYLNAFQQLATNDRFVNVHAIRLAVVNNADWRSAKRIKASG